MKTKLKYEKTGQIWENCERCGKDPVYMPLMICDSCWPEDRVDEDTEKRERKNEKKKNRYEVLC